MLLLPWIYIVLGSMMLVLSIILPVRYIAKTKDTGIRYQFKLIMLWGILLACNFALLWVVGNFEGGIGIVMNSIHHNLFSAYTWLFRLVGIVIVVRGLLVGPRSQRQHVV